MYKEFIFHEPEPERLDIYLTKKLEISRSQIKKLIDHQQVFVNHQVANKTGFLLENNFIVQVNLAETKNLDELKSKYIIEPIQIDFEILYEDQYLLVINKPTNLLVYPTDYQEPVTLVHGLLNYLKWNPNDFDDSLRMGIVHRLDKDTSGLMVIAKTQSVANQLIEMFANHKIEKHYHAIVYNHFVKLNQPLYLDLEIGFEKNGKYKMQVAKHLKNGKQAISIVTPLQNLNQGFSLVNVQILTGRTHQIRATLRYLNHPILNDPIYGPKTKNDSYGQYLICNYLSFVHPISHQPLVFQIPYDKTFQKMYEKLS